jgi:prepilin-type N-terminal cleavage/methylation domain-containing protein/prepilin-type processing-associated H-X9-DG protein
MSRTRGFTLIELLVVIAIIAILAAILFPVFAKAREKARQTSCASNEKELALGFMMYVDDYEETMPDINNDTGEGCLPYWDLFQPYLKNRGILKCPSASGVYGTCDGARKPNITTARGEGEIYMWQEHVLKEHIKTAQVAKPAEMIIFTESGCPYNGWGNWTRVGNGRCANCMHNEGVNAALMDGHVKWYKQNAIWSMYGGDPRNMP